MSEIAKNKRRLVEAVDTLVKKSAPQLEDIDAVCASLSAVLTDLFSVPMSVRLDADAKRLDARLNEIDPTHDL